MNPSNLQERLSSSAASKVLLDITHDDKYAEAKTPDVIEGGAIRPGGAPKLYSKENIGVLAQYAATGIVYGTMINVTYPLLANYLHMSGTESASANALLAIPTTWRLFFGGLSDCYPIFGYRRRPYIVFGWLVAFVACFIMAVIPLGDPYYKNDPSLAYTPESELTPEQIAGFNKDAPSSGVKYILLLVLGVLGTVLSGSVADGALAELAQREPENIRGSVQTMSFAWQMLFQSLAYAMTGFGMNDAKYGGTFSYSMGFNAIMGVAAFFSLAVLPLSWFCITEEKNVPAQSAKKYISDMFELLQHRVMYQIVAYRFFRNLFNWISSTAAYPVQTVWVKVTPANSSTASILGSVVNALAFYCVKRYGLQWSWHKVIAITTLLAIAIDCIPTFFTVWDVYRSQWFWLGMPIVEYLPYFIAYAITTLAAVEIIDVGNEAGVYGLLMTVENVAYPFSTVISKNICANFDIDYEFLQTDDHYARSQVSYTYIIAYIFKIFQLAFLVLLPRQKAETQELKRTGGKSKMMGIITIVYVTFAFLWSLMTNLMTFSSSTSCLKIAGGSGC